jgi:hypothetical protein
MRSVAPAGPPSLSDKILKSTTSSMKNLGLTQHTAALAALLLLPGLADHARGEPWTPADLSDKALWLDAADAGTITLNGSTVSQWDDKSGNSRNFAQATGANQPAYPASPSTDRATSCRPATRWMLEPRASGSSPR